MTGRRAGSLIPKGDRKWLLRWFVGVQANGKRKYSSETFEGSAVQARKVLAKKTVSVDEGTHVIPTHQTVAQYLDWWLKNIAASEVTPVSLSSYANRVKVINKTLGVFKVSKLTWQIIQQFYNGLRDAGKSGRTVRYTHTILKTALSHAVRGKLLRDNPCDHASPGAQDKVEMKVWSASDVQVFLDRTKGERDHALWFTLLHTGLRPGEALALKWADLKDERLQVVRAVAEIDAKQHRLEDVKTAAGRRSIVLTKENIETLQAHRKAQLAAILAAGPEYARNDFIFATSTGQYDLVSRLSDRWKRAVRRVNVALKAETTEGEAVQLKLLHLYGCRHTHATLLLHAGVHPKVVQERLGHASITITLDTYSHVLPTMQEEAVGKLRILMGNGGTA